MTAGPFDGDTSSPSAIAPYAQLYAAAEVFEASAGWPGYSRVLRSQRVPAIVFPMDPAEESEAV